MEEKLNESKREENELAKKKELFDKEINYIDNLIIENEKQFESKITYLGAGTIALTLTFADNHNGCKWLLILGLVFMCIPVCINLYSQLWMKDILRKDQKYFADISNGIYSFLNNNKEDEQYINNKPIINEDKSEITKHIDSITIKRCYRSDVLSKTTIWIMYFGIIFTLLYVLLSLN